MGGCGSLPGPSVGRGRQRLGGRPRPQRVLGPREVVDAHVGSGVDVLCARSVGVDQRRVSTVVLERRVGEEDLEAAARGHVQGLVAVHHGPAVLRALTEAVVELAEHGARHVGDDPVEDPAAGLVDVDVVVDHRAQEAAGLRAAVGVGVTQGPCRGIAVGNAAVTQPRRAVAQRHHTQ